MPKLIDYFARNDLIREAVVRIAARDGGRAVTLAAVAAEMAVSQSTLRRTVRSPDLLAMMGVGWLARTWQQGRFQRGRPRRTTVDPVERARWYLWFEVPHDEVDVEQARAWAELTTRGAGETIAEHRRDQDSLIDELVCHLLGELEVPEAERELEQTRVRALVDGLTSAVCENRITIGQLEACLGAHLRQISHLPEGSISPDAA